MAVDPKARIQTVSYKGGRATAALGILEKLFGTQNLSWTTPNAGTFTRPGTTRQRIIGGPSRPVKASTPRRKSWVGRNASPNGTGQSATVYFTDGSQWEIRFSGPFTDLKSAIANGSVANTVSQIMTERGATANKGIPIVNPA
jgi:hypothetical protein